VNFYDKEIKALKRSGRFRERKVLDANLHDFASNDYLGLAHNKNLHKATAQELEKLPSHSSKASLLVNGYHPIHKDFEEALSQANGFEDAVVVGSGFNANIAMVEALCRKGDMLFMDELYHASGILATQLEHVNVVFFKHNDMLDLQLLLKQHAGSSRKIIAVEGIYSMDGDLCDKEVFEIADTYDAILIVDEAHSSGVVGENLMGVFDLYGISVQDNHIKMGTLGKAYGGFGAYILGSKHIISYLINRAKPIVYATALSLYDTLLAHKSLEYILQYKEQLSQEIMLRKMIIQKELGMDVDGLIVPLVIGDNKKVLKIKEELEKQGFSIGAIRQPTVPSAILRIIARVGESEVDLIDLCKKIVKIMR